MHCMKRGGRGLDIVKDESDRYRFVQSLDFLRKSSLDGNWYKTIVRYSSPTAVISVKNKKDKLERIEHIKANNGGEKNITKILAFTLLTNHFHIIFQETSKGGVSLFMKKLGQSMTNHFNAKYNSVGSIFQGGYKGKRIKDDRYLRWVVPYVMVKNTFEMHPRGLIWCVKNFEEAWRWAIDYPFSSLGVYAGMQKSSIVDPTPLTSVMGERSDFKKLCRDMIQGSNTQDRYNKEFAKIRFLACE